MGLKLERSYPWIVGLLAVLGYVVLTALHGKDIFVNNEPRTFLSMVNDVNAIFVGFLMTTIGIIWSIQDRPGIKFQKQAGTYEHFIRYIFEAAIACFLTVTINLVIAGCITANYYVHGILHRLLILLWIALHSFAVSSCYRVIATFYAIAKSDVRSK